MVPIMMEGIRCPGSGSVVWGIFIARCCSPNSTSSRDFVSGLQVVLNGVLLVGRYWLRELVRNLAP
jgi:hypothetical protein